MKKLLWILAILFISCKAEKVPLAASGTTTEIPTQKKIKIGLFADAQYCDCPPEGTRFYRNTLQKLQTAIDTFNVNKVDYIFSLGDLIDRNFESFNAIMPLLDQAQAPVHQVLGNHDFVVADSLKELVPGRMGLTEKYYDIKISDDWRVIVLDGNDISLVAYPENHPKYMQAQNILAKLIADGAPNAKTWNGAVGDEQLQWLRNKLINSEEKILILCHYPVFPEGGRHNLWNDKVIRDLMEEFSDKIVGYYNGHSHKEYFHAPFYSLKGMVETEFENAYYIIEL